MSDNKSKVGLFPAFLALGAKSLKLVKLLKFFKVAKPFLLLASIAVSVIGYAFMLGPWLAVLFVVLLLVHEMGHVAVMHRKGFKTPVMVFIPFLGAAVFTKNFGDRDTEAAVGYGGPLLGTAATLLVMLVWIFMPKGTPWSSIVLAAGFLGSYINLFNLVPVSPLDGGRITQAAGTQVKYFGISLLAIASALMREPAILYIWIIVFFEMTMFPPRFRAAICASCWVAMAGLMSLGYGSQPIYVNALDCLFTSPFVLIAVVSARRKQEWVAPDDRPQLPPSQRWSWLARYLALSAVLGVCFFVQVHYMPKHQLPPPPRSAS